MKSYERQEYDKAITAAARILIDDMGAPLELVIDRLLTFAAAHMVAVGGKEHAAEAFRDCAEAVEAGGFDHLEPRKRMIPQ